MWSEYITAGTLDEAIMVLASNGDRARIVAGATDLMLELERGQRQGVDTLIDISRLPGLDAIKIDGDRVVLGPLVTHAHAASSQVIIENAFALARACWEVGAPQIRSRGTIAGNLITASPANDSIPPLLALGAEVELVSSKESRTVPLDQFYRGVRETVMRPDEVLTAISFPMPAQGTRSTFIKLGLRRAQAISVVNAAVLLVMEGDTVGRAVITLGSVAPMIIHAEEAETYLIGKQLTSETIQQTADFASSAAHPIDDLRGSAVYRSDMVHACVARALRAISEGREREGYPHDPVLLSVDQAPGSPEAVSGTHVAGTPISTSINGQAMTFTTGHQKSLLRLLREEGALIGTKEGCAEGECGACTVFLDGTAVMACLVPAPRAQGAEIVTIEGLGADDSLHPVQESFIEAGAVQCGYCTPGFIMSAAMLLEEKPKPTYFDIQQAISGNLCRCTGYYKIIEAIEVASKAVDH